MITALIFVGTYAIIAAGRAPFLRLDRTGAAIVGAILMVVTGAIGFEDAVRAVDFPTIVLLFSMMIIVAHLRLAGGLAAFVRFISVRVRHPGALIAALVFGAGLLSALFVNDTICLVFTPIVLDVAAARRHLNVPAVMLFTKIVPRLPDPHSAWLALAMSSTLAGNLTILGSIANLIVVEGARRRGTVISFWDFGLVGVPLSLITIGVGV